MMRIAPVLAQALLMTAGLLVMPELAGADQGDLTVTVPNIKNNGELFVSVCTKDTFLESNCPYKASAKVIPGEGKAVVTGVPAGTYAVQIFADENGNGKLDRTMLGVPKEGVGFSRDPSYTFSAPGFGETSFEMKGDHAITINLRYW